MAKERPKDRRISKTQALLHEALGGLLQEKPYDEIVVKEILERANVGRSTFYSHYRDKDELLVSGIHEMLQTVHSTPLPSVGKGPERLLQFSLPVFEHIYRHRQTGMSGIGIRGRAVIHEHLRQVVAGLVAAEVAKIPRGQRKTTNRMPPDLLVQHIASTFVLVLNWWTESGNALKPKEVDELFRALILPTLSASQTQ